MASVHSIVLGGQSQGGFHAEIAEFLEVIDATALLRRLQNYRPTGRSGYPLRALWRAYAASFFLNLPHTNALIRTLEGDKGLRRLCGFHDLPHRTTFNRFVQRLSRHADLVESCFASITAQIEPLLPDLGKEVAIDSTAVRTHSNPNRRRISDPEASWTAKNSAGAKEGGKEWRFGYKVHMVADANYGLPLASLVTTAKRNDSPELPPVMDHAAALNPWLRPAVAIADRGYDSLANHEHLIGKGAVPVIHLRRPSNTRFHGGIYTERGVPTCLGLVPMAYVRSDPARGHLYRCQGCHLAKSRRGGVRHCADEVWEDPQRNVRISGAIRRDGPEWKRYYAKRQAIERVFKSLKESRRLERHCVRGLRQITLHALMSALAYQATALVRILAGEPAFMRWMVNKVA